VTLEAGACVRQSSYQASKGLRMKVVVLVILLGARRLCLGCTAAAASWLVRREPTRKRGTCVPSGSLPNNRLMNDKKRGDVSGSNGGAELGTPRTAVVAVTLASLATVKSKRGAGTGHSRYHVTHQVSWSVDADGA